MGGCASVNKGADSKMKLQTLFRSKNDKAVIPSPVKETPTVNVDRPMSQGTLRSQSHTMTTVRDICSKEEKFFDSQPWIDSDCDDDFFSVNGDFTPSRGNTPVHHSFSVGTPRVNGSTFNESPSEPSPNKKKRLSELFQESPGGDQDNNDHITPGYRNRANGKVENKATILGLPPRPVNRTPLSSERTPNRDYGVEKVRAMNSVHCCLPRLITSRSFNERKNKMSPVNVIGPVYAPNYTSRLIYWQPPLGSLTCFFIRC